MHLSNVCFFFSVIFACIITPHLSSTVPSQFVLHMANSCSIYIQTVKKNCHVSDVSRLLGHQELLETFSELVYGESLYLFISMFYAFNILPVCKAFLLFINLVL